MRTSRINNALLVFAVSGAVGVQAAVTLSTFADLDGTADKQIGHER